MKIIEKKRKTVFITAVGILLMVVIAVLIRLNSSLRTQLDYLTNQNNSSVIKFHKDIMFGYFNDGLHPNKDGFVKFKNSDVLFGFSLGNRSSLIYLKKAGLNCCDIAKIYGHFLAQSDSYQIRDCNINSGKIVITNGVYFFEFKKDSLFFKDSIGIEKNQPID